MWYSNNYGVHIKLLLYHYGR